ncbi:nuclease-related domain-containing protein [Halalkalibacter sp. APA_J-10(15)]|uniref:nuclease-related domain-containing protein n=1 Tax=unclassified Halalkalibacter TaxID=2893063 RepID=UPI001FF22B94|nr:nuclease-related domain-containing protein [Halalkalibacter sp. APA_J-10(15)]MCK0471270.1 NERD domain-containing protein [Halalkalibacter sp. APA_J-10(15)]
MAHLIKLKDYSSRYQFDIQRYPSQYTRYKKERWYYLKTEWDQLQFDEDRENQEQVVDHNRLRSFFTKFIRWGHSIIPDVNSSDRSAQTLDDVKKQYAHELFKMQIKWATSMKTGELHVDEDFEQDEWLRFFAQQIPDSYFLLYHPVFLYKKAEIDLDIVLISPSEIWCITILDGKEHSVFEARSGRYWFEYIDKTKKQRINPLITLKRMRAVIEERLKESSMTFSIKQVVLCRNGMIDYKLQGTNVEFIDKREFNKWLERLQNHPSPIKHNQMQVATLLLNECVDKKENEEEEKE